MSAEAFWAPPPPPKTKLGRHRQLSPTAGIHVSPICLGGMSIGDQWGPGLGQMNKDSSFKLLDAFYDAGSNFIDTANNYQDETSEQFIGEWIEARGVRDQMVIATKYSENFKRGRDDINQKTSYVGNSMKSLHVSVEQSLKKLRTDYIDILYIHWWDYLTGIEEVMNGLHALVMAGKVLYLGVCNTPAWIVSSANRYARLTGRTPFTIYQGAWSILIRDFERDIIPMVRAEGMALAPWYVLGGGKIMTDEQERQKEAGEGGRTFFGDWKRNEKERAVAKALEEVAAEVGAPNIQAVAIAYVMQKTPHVFPIMGGRKVEQLHANIQALDVALSDEHIKKLEDASPFDKGFNVHGDGTSYGFFHSSAGHFDRWPVAPAIRPKNEAGV